ncbi:MAG: serine/threonine protein kinase [Gammaproteobacteria bacterium]|nr:serine/threonine protein kinase [Gammaproteobacteria bacterium]
MTEETLPPYSGLTPDTIITALESCGFHPDGSMLALNSYENRVYQIGQEDALPLVAKFYRPGRWSDAAIQEEHEFSLSLAAEEIPVVAPLQDAEGNTLHSHAGYRFSLSPRQGGRWPDLDDPDDLMWAGRLMARIHQLGASQPFEHRPSLNPQEMGSDSAHYLLENNFVPIELESRYRQTTEELQQIIDSSFDSAGPYQQIRLHGDCHPGNILWTDNGPHFVDLDDCRNGPAIQDLWMLLSGERNEMAMQLSYLREGYEMFRPLNPAEVHLIEPLRTLRIIHYAAWLARRWDDPAFPAAFPWFNTNQYWQDHIATLAQQRAAMENPPLALY